MLKLCENCSKQIKKDLSNYNSFNKNDILSLQIAGIYELDHLIDILWNNPIRIRKIKNIGPKRFKRIVEAAEKEIGVKIPIL